MLLCRNTLRLDLAVVLRNDIPVLPTAQESQHFLGEIIFPRIIFLAIRILMVANDTHKKKNYTKLDWPVFTESWRILSKFGCSDTAIHIFHAIDQLLRGEIALN
jgi:hypothetical protein